MEPAAAYALWASSYPAQAHNPLMRAEERAMLGLMQGGLAGQRVLDVGCGSGRYMLHALRGGATPGQRRGFLAADVSNAPTCSSTTTAAAPTSY